VLYDRLRVDGAAGKCDEVLNIIRILIKDRGERPNTQMYSAILHSYANSEKATGRRIRMVLQEMQENGVELDGRGAECVLEALAVHPDYLLRTDVLRYMKERWFNLSDRGHNFVVAGLLRDRAFEQALEKLEDMVRQRIKVEVWLWDKTIWMLLEFGEVEEAFYVLSLRQGLGGPAAKLSKVMWLQLLDTAAKKHLVSLPPAASPRRRNNTDVYKSDATAMIWNTQVTPGYLKPPTGTCLHVLSGAARDGNVKLATDVFRVLTERDTILTSHHYEALIECYLSAGDLPTSLSVILIMQNSGLRVSPDALHPLYTYLSKDASRPMEAFKRLQTLSSTSKKEKIPLVLVNTCIQACCSQSLNALSDGIEIYKALHKVCKTGPNTATFNILLQGCSHGNRKELAMFLANEMMQLGLKPDRLTYDRLVLVCLGADTVGDALLYYEEMTASGWYPRQGTFEALINEALKKGDERAVALVRDYGEKGGAGERLPHFEKIIQKKFEVGGGAGRKLGGWGDAPTTIDTPVLGGQEVTSPGH
jgi:pentatricopeptide repeat protein